MTTCNLIEAADELLEAGDVDAIRFAYVFALLKLDAMDPRSDRFGDRVESTDSELLTLLSSEPDDFTLMVFVDHVEERLQIAA
ncbi:hypothetical protein [Lacipirellula parvula]|uniref:Uncharacterized protein n=1 Tax=Lacipirellula parvula TaxID=2650471 RepID=A0A5K7X8R9_9BACT|nr:hypothetical protein [Lacipirellula parvula]BBO32257.1 hypothetical protein PLANPX_1869 [Lacipirellula parvula]